MADETPKKRDWARIVQVWLPFVLNLVFWLIACGLYITGRTTDQPGPPPIIPTIDVAAGDAPPPNAFGWVHDDDEVDRIKSGLVRPVFGDTPAGKQADPLPPAIYLWDAYRKINDGRNPPAHDQNPVGSCVSFGSSRAYERSLAVQILAGDPFEFRSLCEEAIYGLSRVEIGGGRIRGDGSVGAWAAKGFQVYGGLPRGQYGNHDLTRYDPDRCRDWGRRGLPDELEPEARRFPAGDCTQIRTWAEAKRALAQGYGIAICSDQGFARQRDQNGVCRAQGSWAHCMALDGYHTTPEGKEYGHIENSWGPNYHVGPVGWGEPNTAGFWAEAGVIERMLRQNDSWAISSVRGFPARDLGWFVHKETKRDPFDLRPRADRAGLVALAW